MNFYQKGLISGKKNTLLGRAVILVELYNLAEQKNCSVQFCLWWLLWVIVMIKK